METIEQKLDRLAEYESQRDLIEINKRAALDDVKVPFEVENIVKNSMLEIAAVEDTMRPAFQQFKAQIQQELSQIVIPEEIKAQLAEIDAQRTALLQKQSAFETETLEKIRAKKAEIQATAEEKTRSVYADIERRKREIEEEFSDNLGAVNANIEALKAEIKKDTIAQKQTFKGSYYTSIFTKGRVTWATDALDSIYHRLNGVLKKIDSLVSIQDELSEVRQSVKEIASDLSAARKEGEPSTQLRKI